MNVLRGLSRRFGQRWLGRTGLMLALVAVAPALQAHPLGQNAYNREAAIVVEPDGVHLHYLLDLAEIPTLAVGEEADADRDGEVSDAEWTAYAERWARTLPDSLVIKVGGRRLPLALESQNWTTAPGQSGLSTMRLKANLRAELKLTDRGAILDYRDETRADRLGWKEVWISADKGARIVATTVPQQDRSKALTDFTPRAEGPPALLSAHAEIALAAPGSLDEAAAAQASVDAAAADFRAEARAGSAKPPNTDQTTPIWSFFKLGIHHIATGWDHLMFLLGLVLLSGNIKRLIKTVSAFTVSHSVTLALAAKGLVQPPGPWVEALIAATIAYVGVIALLRRPNNHGVWLAFGFGFIHGFGFAGALAESLGSGNNLRLTGLISFNMGIEAFQVSLVCAAMPLLSLAARRPWYGGLYLTLASAVFFAGTIWFLLRTVGEGWPAALALVLVSAAAALVLNARRDPHGLTQA